MPRETIRIRSAWHACVWSGALLMVAAAALAQDEIVVSSAEPNTAEQETYDLEVMVGGQNFPSDAEVDFFVTGTEEPGGITVKKVKRQGPKSLKVTIDVAPDAQFEQKFDIRVRSRRGGRSGKGTELFGVTQKVTGTPDTTPPGDLTDLTTDQAGVTATTIPLSWTAVADDGYDAATGPATKYWIKYKLIPETGCTANLPDAEYVMTEADKDSGASTLYTLDFPPPAPAGSPMSFTMEGMEPEMTYTVAIWVTDEGWNGGTPIDIGTHSSGVSNTVCATTPAIDSGPWQLSLVGTGLGAVHGLAWDENGDPVIATFSESGEPCCSPGLGLAWGTWTGTDWSWTFEAIPALTNASHVDFAYDAYGWGPMFIGSIVEGPKQERGLYFVYYDGFSWVTEQVWKADYNVQRRPENYNAVLVSDDNSGVPAVCGYLPPGKGGGESGLIVARRYASGWQSEMVDSQAGECQSMISSPDGLAVGYHVNSSPTHLVELAREIPGEPWAIETVASPSDQALAGSLARDPLTLDYAIIYSQWQEPGGWPTELCRANGGAWSCEALPEPLSDRLGVQLEFDWAGTAMIAGETDGPLSFGLHSPADSVWTTEAVDFPGYMGPDGAQLSVKSDGTPGLAYNTKPPREEYIGTAWFAWRPQEQP